MSRREDPHAEDTASAPLLRPFRPASAPFRPALLQAAPLRFPEDFWYSVADLPDDIIWTRALPAFLPLWEKRGTSERYPLPQIQCV